ncbi:hypothetical protein EMIHUDRAFT_460064, partial [Emiliania huxleyi CCMP1516]
PSLLAGDGARDRRRGRSRRRKGGGVPVRAEALQDGRELGAGQHAPPAARRRPRPSPSRLGNPLAGASRRGAARSRQPRGGDCQPAPPARGRPPQVGRRAPVAGSPSQQAGVGDEVTAAGAGGLSLPRAARGAGSRGARPRSRRVPQAVVSLDGPGRPELPRVRHAADGPRVRGHRGGRVAAVRGGAAARPERVRDALLCPARVRGGVGQPGGGRGPLGDRRRVAAPARDAGGRAAARVRGAPPRLRVRPDRDGPLRERQPRRIGGRRRRRGRDDAGRARRRRPRRRPDERRRRAGRRGALSPVHVCAALQPRGAARGGRGLRRDVARRQQAGGGRALRTASRRSRGAVRERRRRRAGGGRLAASDARDGVNGGGEHGARRTLLPRQALPRARPLAALERGGRRDVVPAGVGAVGRGRPLAAAPHDSDALGGRAALRHAVRSAKDLAAPLSQRARPLFV